MATVRESHSHTQDHQSGERSSEILAAARGLFARKGYESTSVKDIARTVGVADGAIYRYFPSKRAVLSGVIREFYEPVIDMARYNIEGIRDVRQRLRYLIWLQAKAFAEQPELCRLIIAEARPMEDYYESEIADLNRRYTTLLVEVIRTGQKEGVFRGEIDPAMVRDLVYGGLEHIAWGAVTGRRTIDPDAVADDLMELVCCGIDTPRRNEDAVDLTRQLNKLEALVDRLGV